MMAWARKLWECGREILPASGFHFDRPLVLLQSDDWGRVGLLDQQGLEQLRASGLVLGERPYDFYTLETAKDVAALGSVLKRHHDSSGRHPVLVMNFILANLDFGRMRINDFREIQLLPLADGLPQGWDRPGLLDAYRDGIAARVFYPALHGMTHFSRLAVERNLARDGERSEFLRVLWKAGTPYIYWRMPWIGYEYWDPENQNDDRFLPANDQLKLIGNTVGSFAKLFSVLPHSACAPGYRSNDDTHRIWAQHGVRVVQNGSGYPIPPYFERHGLLHITRAVEFEPATDAAFSVEAVLNGVEACFERGIPAIISVHSINFHSSVKDFCTTTLEHLDALLKALESKHPDLLYLHDEDMYRVVTEGICPTPSGAVRVKVRRKIFSKAPALWQGKS